MQMLYDSESFVVVHMLPDVLAPVLATDTPEPAPQLARHGFQIVDKRSGKELYLDGSWAEMFQQKILAWQRDAPTQEEVEDTLDRYTGLAQNPVVVHYTGLTAHARTRQPRRCALTTLTLTLSPQLHRLALPIEWNEGAVRTVFDSLNHALQRRLGVFAAGRLVGLTRQSGSKNQRPVVAKLASLIDQRSKRG